MLKSPIKRYLAKTHEGVTWEQKVAALKNELTAEQLKTLGGQVSTSKKGQTNKRGGQDKPRDDTRKVQPAPALPGVAHPATKTNAPSSGQPRGSCNNFWNTGRCRFDTSCKFQHVANNGEAVSRPQPAQPVAPAQQPAAGQPAQQSQSETVPVWFQQWLKAQAPPPMLYPQRPYPPMGYAY